jgi:hypothetical protein
MGLKLSSSLLIRPLDLTTGSPGERCDRCPRIRAAGRLRRRSTYLIGAVSPGKAFEIDALYSGVALGFGWVANALQTGTLPC